MVCIESNSNRDTQVYTGEADNPDKSWDDDARSDFENAEIYLGIISAADKREAVELMSEKEGLPAHILVARTCKV